MREAFLTSLPPMEALEAADAADVELAYVLAVLKACCDSPALGQRLPLMLQTVAHELQRVRVDQQTPDLRAALEAAQRLWSGEPGPN